MKEMILIHSALSDDTRTVVISVETELTNMDLKSISARSLPCPHTLRKSSHLLSPKVLQIAWVGDVTKFRMEGFMRNTSNRRLLKLGFTDGHSEVAAVEYSYITTNSLWLQTVCHEIDYLIGGVLVSRGRTYLCSRSGQKLAVRN